MKGGKTGYVDKVKKEKRKRFFTRFLQGRVADFTMVFYNKDNEKQAGTKKEKR